MDIVINFDSERQIYKIYEGSTETLLVSQDLAEGMFNMNTFLKMEGHIPEGSDIFRVGDVSYHLDSTTMNAILKSNINLVNRLRSGPSEFKISSEKFGGSSSSAGPGNGYKRKGDFSHQSKNFGKGSFSGKSKFNDSNKKWTK